MEQDDDPYQVLGFSEPQVSSGISDSQIRQAYRKLAFQHHPDKQTTPEAKAQANQTFAKISNAYELLKDEASRRAYDERKGQGQNQSFASSSSFPQQPFGSAFHDPFQVFQEFFGQNFNQGISMSQNNLFHDPFFGGSMNSFFGGGMMMGGTNSLFSSSFRDPSFLGGTAGFGGNTTTTTFMSSSSSSIMGGSGQRQSISTSTTTRVINGQAETVQETVIQKPDGKVERKTQVLSGNGNNNSQRLEDDTYRNSKKRALPAPCSADVAASPQNQNERKEEGGETRQERTEKTKDDPSSQKQDDESEQGCSSFSKRPPSTEDKEDGNPSSTKQPKEEETASSAEHDPQYSVQHSSRPKKQKV